MGKRVVLLSGILAVLLLVVCAAIWAKGEAPKPPAHVKVGYLAITPNLPFYMAVEKGVFKNHNLEVEPVLCKTSNELAEALITKRIDFTTTVALSVLQSLEVASPGRIKIYQVNYIPTSSPNDFLLVKKGSPLKTIADLKGKKIGLFPGSNFEAWAKLIFGEHFGFGADFTTVQMPPELLAQALAAGSVDAIYALEPTGTIVQEKGLGQVLDVGLVCKYIFDPFPVTGNAVLSEYAAANPETTKVFCDAMYEAMRTVRDNPDAFRQYLAKYCNIPDAIAAKVKLGHDEASANVDVEGLQKTVDLYMKEGVLTKSVDMRSMLLYPPEKK